MKKELSEELLKTYYPYWEEMKRTLDLGYRMTPGDYKVAIQSILIKAYMNALKVGFEEGVNWEKLKANKK